MITLTLFDNNMNKYTHWQEKVLMMQFKVITDDGHTIRWDDHNGWSWATIQLEDDTAAVLFKLKYL